MLTDNFKILKNKLFSLIVAIILLFNLSGCTKNSTKEKLTKVRLNEVARSVFYSPQYVAIANNYFKDNGIDIVFSIGNGSDRTMTSLLSSQSDIALLGPETAIYVNNEKNDFNENSPVLFAQLTKKDGNFIVGYDNNFNFNSLKNKKIISGRKGGLPAMVFSYVLSKNNVNLNDVKLLTNISFDLMAPSFLQGIGDYTTLFEPTASMVCKKSSSKILKSIGEEVGEIPYTCYCSTKSYIENNKNIVEKFVKAIYQGQIWVKDHDSKEIAEKVSQFFPTIENEILISSIENYKNYGVWALHPRINENSFNLLLTIINEHGEEKVKCDFDNLVNNSFCDKIQQN